MPNEHTYFKTILDYFENGMMFGNLLQNQGIVPSEDRQYSVSSQLEFIIILVVGILVVG